MVHERIANVGPMDEMKRAWRRSHNRDQGGGEGMRAVRCGKVAAKRDGIKKKCDLGRQHNFLFLKRGRRHIGPEWDKHTMNTSKKTSRNSAKETLRRGKGP